VISTLQAKWPKISVKRLNVDACDLRQEQRAAAITISMCYFAVELYGSR